MADSSGTVLVKDGAWNVPPEERPSGWQTMAVRESVETTHTETCTQKRTTRETLIAVQEPESALEVAHEEQEIVVVYPPKIPRIGTIPSSPIPINPIAQSVEVMDLLAKYADDNIGDEEIEPVWTRISEIGDEVKTHRVAKQQVEILLSGWIEKHREKLRHVGLNSEPIRDLYLQLHDFLYELIRDQDKLLTRKVRQARHGDKCDCWDCKVDRGERPNETVE